jgi:hypothetical protein
MAEWGEWREVLGVNGFGLLRVSCRRGLVRHVLMSWLGVGA